MHLKRHFEAEMVLFSIKIYFRYLVAAGKRNDHPCESLYLKDQINRAIIVENLYSKEALEIFYKTYESPKDQKKWAEKSESSKKRDKGNYSGSTFRYLFMQK